jgi:ABC-type transport system involved in Fe-S cluster assembly fused permease/ATPase subunit
MLGLLAPDHGQVLVDGQDIRAEMGSWQRQIGYVPQDVYLLDDTIVATSRSACRTEPSTTRRWRGRSPPLSWKRSPARCRLA